MDFALIKGERGLTSFMDGPLPQHFTSGNDDAVKHDLWLARSLTIEVQMRRTQAINSLPKMKPQVNTMGSLSSELSW